MENRITFTVQTYALVTVPFCREDTEIKIDEFDTRTEAEKILNAYIGIGRTNLTIKPIYKYTYTVTEKEWQEISKIAKMQV